MLPEKVNGESVNIYVRPIYHNNQISGVSLSLFFSDKFFDDLIIPETFDQEGCSYIADKKGTIIFQSQGCSEDEKFAEMTQMLSHGWNLKGKKGAALGQDIQNNMSGVTEYALGKQGMYISYVPIKFHDWYFINITASNIAEEQSKSLYEGILPSFLYIPDRPVNGRDVRYLSEKSAL